MYCLELLRIHVFAGLKLKLPIADSRFQHAMPRTRSFKLYPDNQSCSGIDDSNFLTLPKLADSESSQFAQYMV